MPMNPPTPESAASWREPTLYLHIGRNKAGSMTLRNHFARHAAEWLPQGLEYALFGHDDGANPELPFFASHVQLAGHFAGAGGRSVLISNETISCFTPAFTHAMASGLAGLNVRVLFYVRPYGDWALSSYKFDVRTGFNALDFDRYLEDLRPRMSFWPALEIWGETLGWDRVRVRSLHPADLVGGELIADCHTALGLPPPQAERLIHTNASSAWTVTELLRLVATGGPAMGWQGPQQTVAYLMHHLHESAASSLGPQIPDGTLGPGQYFTRAQADWMARLYNQDLATLAARSGTKLQSDDRIQAHERPFLPSAAQVPSAILRRMRDLGQAPAIAHMHPEAAAFVTSAAFTTLCGER